MGGFLKKGACRLGAENAVLRPEGVQRYVEREETALANKYNKREEKRSFSSLKQNQSKSSYDDIKKRCYV